jgi:hypothetical protein
LLEGSACDRYFIRSFVEKTFSKAAAISDNKNGRHASPAFGFAMRLISTLCLLTALFFAGCAYEGTVVRKEYRPLPFSYSLGIDGIYKFELRDRAGRIHSQLVTPLVFANYEIGDYFNDLQPLPPDAFQRGPAPLEPPMLRPPVRGTPEYEDIPEQPRRTTSVPQTAPRTAVPASRKVLAKKHRKSHRRLARARRSHASDPS